MWEGPQKMDLGDASQTTGNALSHNEQTVSYMDRLSQELRLDILQSFIHKIWNHNAFWHDANCETGQEADPHNISLYLAEIRSLCRPTSKSTGRNVHVNV